MSEDQVKDKEQTMQKLIMAFDKILVEEGFQKLGINKIALTAGVSKVLIYRYFGDFNGLLEAYLTEKAYWITTQAEISGMIESGTREEVTEGAVAIFQGLADLLFYNKVYLEIERWELLENNPILDTICQKIENPTGARNKAMADRFGIPEAEMKAIIAILSGGIAYLFLRAKTVPYYNNVSIRTEEGLAEIKSAIAIIIRKCFN